MPHLFSGLHQKRQSGKLIYGTQIAGSKGRSSVMRMVSHCKSNSENPSDCINTVLNNIKENKPNKDTFNPNANILFNIESFSKLFDLDGSGNSYDNNEGADVLGYRRIDSIYIQALTNAANRWNTYIKYTPEMNSLIYNTVKGYNGNIWKGIELDNCQYINTNPNTLASAAAYTFEGTTINFKFLLKINNISIQNYNMNILTDLFTHELGHVLGMPCWTVLDGNGDEVLPLSELSERLNTKIYNGTLTYFDPNYSEELVTINIFPNAVQAYNSYGAYIVSTKNRILSPNNLIPLDNNHEDSLQNYKHWSDTAIIDTTSHPDYDFIYCGLPNEILNPYISETDRSLISKISIKELIDIYTVSAGSKIFNYIEINNNASEVIDKSINEDNYTITFTGNPPSYTRSIAVNEININNKSIKNNRIRLNCDCEPIFIKN